MPPKSPDSTAAWTSGDIFESRRTPHREAAGVRGLFAACPQARRRRLQSGRLVIGRGSGRGAAAYLRPVDLEFPADHAVHDAAAGLYRLEPLAAFPADVRLILVFLPADALLGVCAAGSGRQAARHRPRNRETAVHYTRHARPLPADPLGAHLDRQGSTPDGKTLDPPAPADLPGGAARRLAFLVGGQEGHPPAAALCLRPRAIARLPSVETPPVRPSLQRCTLSKDRWSFSSSASVLGQSMHGSVIDTPYSRLLKSFGMGGLAAFEWLSSIRP